MIPILILAATLQWTAPGDDGFAGTAAQYDIRVALEPITDSTWHCAVPIPNVPTPSKAGLIDTCSVPAGALYFAIVTVDEAGNRSEISNVVSQDACAPEDYNCDGSVDISDLMDLIDYMFR